MAANKQGADAGAPAQAKIKTSRETRVKARMHALTLDPTIVIFGGSSLRDTTMALGGHHASSQ